MSGRFRDKFAYFMSGRNGVDEIGRLAAIVGLIMMIVAVFVPYVLLPAFAIMGYSYFRMFSKNIPARRRENEAFCRLKNRRSSPYRIFKCPNCAQKIRVPRRKGRICIRCPKCHIEFIKKT